MARVDADLPPRSPLLRPQGRGDAAAVRAFNERVMRSGVKIPFLLSESVSGTAALDTRPWLLMDGRDVRGGVLVTRHRAVVAGVEREVVNLQSPITEAVADKRYGSLSIWLFRELERRFTYVYAVGMGGTDRPMPRLLRAMKWQVGLSAFRFMPLAPGRVAARIDALRARIPRPLRPVVYAAGSCAGPLVRSSLRVLGGRSLAEVQPGKDASASVAYSWGGFSKGIRFGIVRDAAAASELYVASDGERVFRAIECPACVAVVRTRALPHTSPFRDLTVATVLELMAPDATRLMQLSRRLLGQLSRGSADIAIINTTHADTVAALDSTGWLQGPSNYVVALSPPFADAGVTLDASYVTRTDGDGRLNL
jgi:hypothetical protein